MNFCKIVLIRLYRLIKIIIRTFYFKIHRFAYFYKYRIPINDKYSNIPSGLVSPLSYFKGFNSVAIIGKGSSIFDINPKKIITDCDTRVLLNRVDIEGLESYIGNKFEVQMTQYVSRRSNWLMPVLSKRLISKYGIDMLICNLNKDDLRFKRYYNFFHNRVKKISYMPHDKLKIDLDIFQYQKDGALTIASNIIRILYNVPTVNKIIFAGVDAYHYGYSHQGESDGKIFHDMLQGNEREKAGVPFLKFLFDYTIIRNKIYPIVIWLCFYQLCQK